MTFARAIGPHAWALAVGGLGVVATCICYRLSPVAAAMPVVPADYGAAQAGALAGASTMRLAGLFGMSGDLLMTAGAAGIAVMAMSEGAGLRALGWLLMALSTVVYTFVDAIVGFVLPVAAGGDGFAVAKSLFDVLFLQGAATFGLGAMLVLSREVLSSSRMAPRGLALIAMAPALAALVGGGASLAGVPGLHTMVGLGIAGGAISFAAIGLVLAVRARGSFSLASAPGRA
jgi:hypothetical protein